MDGELVAVFFLNKKNVIKSVFCQSGFRSRETESGEESEGGAGEFSQRDRLPPPPSSSLLFQLPMTTKLLADE